MASIREATNGNYVLGGKRFQEEVARMLKRRVSRGKAGRPRSKAKRDEKQGEFFAAATMATVSLDRIPAHVEKETATLRSPFLLLSRAA